MARRSPLTENSTLLPPEYEEKEPLIDQSRRPDSEKYEDDLGEPIELEDGTWLYGTEEEEEEESDDSVVDLKEFFENLADDDDILEEVSKKHSQQLLELIEEDIRARQERDKVQSEGIKRTGLGNEAPGGADFDGASRTVHPIITEGCIDFASRMAKEMLPPQGPVKTHIIGKATKEKLKKAERKRQYMNWQLTTQIKEYRDESEQMWTQTPLGGSAYLHWWHNGRKPCVEFLPVDLVIMASSASSFASSIRITIREDRLGEEEFKTRVADGQYRDPETMPDTISPETTESEDATDKIEGKEDPDTNLEGVRGLYTTYCWLDIKSDSKSGGERFPYKITLEQESGKVLEIRRNWDPTLPEDAEIVRMDWLVQWDFMKWRGALGIGLGQMIGSMAGSVTGGIRALLDSAHINNAATLIKLKGANIGGQSTSVDITGIAEIEGPAGLDDIRKLAMPLPFNPPSQVLFDLVELLLRESRSALSNLDDSLKDMGKNVPVATMMAMVEHGSINYSAVHARAHESQRRGFEILHRINKFWIEDEEVVEELGELIVRREDFEGPMDVLPVSDPAIFSEAQRATQVQATLDLNNLFPGRMNQDVLLKRALQVLKVPAVEELLPEKEKPTPKNPVAENLEMFMGQPGFAFPDQDHEAHMQVHLAFLMDQNLGANPAFMNSLVPQFLEHMKQHVGFWYVDMAIGVLSSTSGIDMSEIDYTSQESQDALARALAEAAPFVMQESSRVLGQIGPVLAKMAEINSQMQQAQMQNAMAMQGKAGDASRMAEVQRKTQEGQAKLQLQGQELQLKQQDYRLREQELQQKAQERQAKFISEEKRLQAELQRGAQNAQAQLMKLRSDEMQAQRDDSSKRLAIQIQRLADQEGLEIDMQELENDIRAQDIDLLKNEQDNYTAMQIAKQKLKAGKSTNLKNGNSLDNP